LAAGVVNLSGAISGIDMNGFVTLTEEFSRQQAWY
jgi:sulfur transfer complex TusBCD TusB component (DsrH family)